MYYTMNSRAITIIFSILVLLFLAPLSPFISDSFAEPSTAKSDNAPAGKKAEPAKAAENKAEAGTIQIKVENKAGTKNDAATKDNKAQNAAKPAKDKTAVKKEAPKKKAAPKSKKPAQPKAAKVEPQPAEISPAPPAAQTTVGTPAKQTAAPAYSAAKDPKVPPHMQAIANEFNSFASNWLDKSQQLSISGSKSVTRQGDKFLAFYQEIDKRTMRTEVKELPPAKAKESDTPYVGHIVYDIVVYECLGDSKEQALQGPFVRKTQSMREIFSYSGKNKAWR